MIDRPQRFRPGTIKATVKPFAAHPAEAALQHPMRRRDRELTEAEARTIMARAEYGVLATVGEDGWPYAVAVNHVLVEDRLYFHGALTGHKMANLAHEARVSFTAVASAELLPEDLTTHYESATLFGRATVVLDPAERQLALERLGARFSAGFDPQVAAAIATAGPRTAVVRVQLERITGKANLS